MSDAACEQARSRAAVIGALVARGTVGIAAADRAAVELGAQKISLLPVRGLLPRRTR
ncbi:hypothetical protein QFZ33_000884 [Arthrobacter globiformis]|nr:hypothetical protein [Arthrobacter globiformis]